MIKAQEFKAPSEFRVWNTKEERYTTGYEDEFFAVDSDGCIYLIDTEVSDIYNVIAENIVERSTGVKDKNCRVIYENDVVRFNLVYSEQVDSLSLNGPAVYKEVDHWGEGTVCFSDGAFAIAAESSGLIPLFYANPEMCMVTSHILRGVEVIGTVHDKKDM